VSDIDRFGGWPEILTILSSGEDLSREQARAALLTILSGDATDGQLAGFIIALRMKGECVEELAGLVEAMLEHAAPLDLDDDVIDIVGTGGAPSRRHGALSVSTMACFVAAGAGARVAKHGNVKASATSGAFDTLAALGVLNVDGKGIVACIEEVGCAFVFARAFHPALRFAGPVRAELGVPTVLNILGPVAHPAQLKRQVVGVSDPSIQDLMAGVLASRGAIHSLVVHGSDRLDEITLTGSTRILEIQDGEVVSSTEFEPSSIGISAVDSSELVGGSPDENATIARSMFAGDLKGPKRDIVALNAGAGLLVGGLVDDLAGGYERAIESIESGSAQRVLEEVVRVTAQLTTE